MSISNEQRLQAEENLSEKQRFLYESPESGFMLRTLAERVNLSDSTNYRKLSFLIGDIILGFNQKEDLPTLLKSSFPLLADQMCAIIHAEILAFLSFTPPSTSHSLEPSINQNLRTMPMDMQALAMQREYPTQNIPTTNIPHETPTYQSSQATILNQPTIPTQPNTPPAPRWDTDNRQ